MEYIKNILKELIGIMFLCTILYAIIPRFIKVGIRTTFRILHKVTALATRLVKDICCVAFPSLKTIYDDMILEYKRDKDKFNHRNKRRVVPTKTTHSSKVIKLKRTADNQ